MGPAVESSSAYAARMDREDPLRAFRDRFLFPQHDGRPVIYFAGNSLGLQPKSALGHLKQELDDWAAFGVEGHFKARRPWYGYHEFFSESLARLVGARPTEVVAMNGLTVNVHLMLVSFFRPRGRRTKILCEQRPFPSDTYAMASQIEWHGLDPKVELIELEPRAGEQVLRTEDIERKIRAVGDELALVHLGGVNFITGQAFEMERITKAAHAVGAVAGFDLAHAAGNLHMKLHDWDIDFATWCGYKYLNSGPGAVAGAFVHEKHHQEKLPRLAGWWGHDKVDRFKMEAEFKPMPTVEAWQVSNAPVFSMAVHRAALDLFDEAGMDRLRGKSVKLTAFLESTIQEVSTDAGVRLEVITPQDPDQRGCQLSVIAHGLHRALFDKLTAKGVMIDWREPNVMRMAPVPLYNSFDDVCRFGEILRECLRS